MGLWTGTIVSAFVATFAPRWVDSWRQSEHRDWPPFVPNDPVLPMPVPSVPHVRIDVKPNVREKPKSLQASDFELMPLLERKAKPRSVSIQEATDIVIEYLNDFETTGLLTVTEVDTYCEDAFVSENIERIDPRFVREELASRGLWLGQKRLNTPQYAPIRARTGKSRLVLYRIPKRRVLAGVQPAKASSASEKATIIRPSSGYRPATEETPNDIRRVA